MTMWRGRRVSEQWLGLHNQDDHEWGWGERDAWCTTCEGPRRDRGQCLAKEPCRCCLAAEVEVLREQITCDGVRCAKCEGVPAEIGGLGVLDCYHCSCCEKQALGDQTAAEVLAEVTELHAVVDRVIRLHSRWRQEVLVTLGKPLLDMPGGVLSIPLPSAERQLWHALDGGESDE